jgi:hypothetical protein
MPTVPRPKYRAYYFEVEADLWAKLMERCRSTRRSAKAEMNVALAFWVEQPLGAMPAAPVETMPTPASDTKRPTASDTKPASPSKRKKS